MQHKLLLYVQELDKYSKSANARGLEVLNRIAAEPVTSASSESVIL